MALEAVALPNPQQTVRHFNFVMDRSVTNIKQLIFYKIHDALSTT
jgi:hypothetical protein